MDPSSNIRIRVAGLILENDKILLIAHKKNGEIYWLLPGGGVDYGESLIEALEREFQEELNIKIKTQSVALISDSIDPSGDRHVLNICFYCSIDDGELRLGIDERLHDFDFFSRDEISGLIIHPPINDSLINILERNEDCLYVGKLWSE